MPDQDTALRAEQQLEEMRTALAGLAQTAQLGRADASNARCAGMVIQETRSL